MVSFEVVSLALAPGPTYFNQLEVFGFVVTWADSSIDINGYVVPSRLVKDGSVRPLPKLVPCDLVANRQE